MSIKGRTLWEWFCNLFSGSKEMEIWNPLKSKVTSRVAFDILDRRDRLYPVKALDEHVYRVNGKAFNFTDYVLAAEKETVIRAFPKEDPATRIQGHELVVLELAHSTGHSDELVATLNDQSGEFEWWQNDVMEAKYWRVDDARGHYEAQVTRHEDKDGDGKVQPDERVVTQSHFWDFWRETEDEGGGKVTEYLFVHQDQDSGWITMWRGKVVPPNAVTVL